MEHVKGEGSYASNNRDFFMKMKQQAAAKAASPQTKPKTPKSEPQPADPPVSAAPPADPPVSATPPADPKPNPNPKPKAEPEPEPEPPISSASAEKPCVEAEETDEEEELEEEEEGDEEEEGNSSLQSPARQPIRCRAIGNYAAKNENELSFRQGDTVFVPVKSPGPMWRGVSQGKVGLFPAALVVDVEDEKRLQESAHKVKVLKCRAIRCYDGPPGHLSFDWGDSIMVPKPGDGELWQGVFKGDIGWFPPELVVDVDKHTAEEIDAMILADKQGSLGASAASAAAGGDAFAPGPDPFAPEADPFAGGDEADPFAPQADPFADEADPFAHQVDPFADQADPFAPQADPFAADASDDVGQVDGWSCSSCTFRNNDLLPECEMCQTPRGLHLGAPAAAVAPGSPLGTATLPAGRISSKEEKKRLKFLSKQQKEEEKRQRKQSRKSLPS